MAGSVENNSKKNKILCFLQYPIPRQAEGARDHGRTSPLAESKGCFPDYGGSASDNARELPNVRITHRQDLIQLSMLFCLANSVENSNIKKKSFAHDNTPPTDIQNTIRLVNSIM
jgi:hypothetical protein